MTRDRSVGKKMLLQDTMYCGAVDSKKVRDIYVITYITYLFAFVVCLSMIFSHAQLHKSHILFSIFANNYLFSYCFSLHLFFSSSTFSSLIPHHLSIYLPIYLPTYLHRIYLTEKQDRWCGIKEEKVEEEKKR